MKGQFTGYTRVMENSLPTEVILSHPHRTIGNLHLDWNPQPGSYLDVEGKTYTVLERRHRYQFKLGKYHLHKIALYVQSAKRPDDLSCVDGNWMIGDITCRYNARSELVRCAVNPSGPCAGCRAYEAV